MDLINMSTLADRCIAVLPLDKETGEEFYYSNVFYCAIDTVFSIGVRYEGVKKVVSNVVRNTGITATRKDKLRPNNEEQISVSEFLKIIDGKSVKDLADNFFINQQRTSSTNGILKADAALQLLKILKEFNVQYFEDVDAIFGDTKFENAFQSIKGQASGISLKYFYMLAGNEDIIKPDRMIVRFLKDMLGKEVSQNEAQEILFNTAKEISNKLNRRISTATLDNVIWQYQRTRKV